GLPGFEPTTPELAPLLSPSTLRFGTLTLNALPGRRSGRSLRCGFRHRLHLARSVFAIPALCLHPEMGQLLAVALVVHVLWGLVLHSTFVPSFSLQRDYVVTVVAVLGTTITPYCFFWQSSQEAEDERVDPTAHALIDAPEQAPAEIARMRFDTHIGMGYSNVISLFIIVATAATLNAHGVTDIQTSAQAAEALRPIVGVFTFALFAAGIIGIGLLAVPVLAASGAYAFFLEDAATT